MSRSLTARQRLGGTIRLNPNDAEKIAAARRDLAEAKLSDYIERVIAEAPKLSSEQLDRLALLLNGAR